MPTYQYACTECDHAFEQVQSFSQDSLTTCPHCEGRLRKIFSAVGVVFKGSGFYRTDSRADAKSSAASTSNESSSTETKSDSTDTSTKSDKSTSSSTPKATAGAA